MVAQSFGPKAVKKIVPEALPPSVRFGLPIEPSMPTPPVPGLLAVPVKVAMSLIMAGRLPSPLMDVMDARVVSVGCRGVTLKHSLVLVSVGLVGSLDGGTPTSGSPE